MNPRVANVIVTLQTKKTTIKWLLIEAKCVLYQKKERIINTEKY